MSDYDEVKHEGLFDGGDTTVTLTLDDGELLECVVLTIFEAGGKEYIALMPESGEDEDGNVFLYRYAETEDGQPDLTNIESDEEYEIVSDAFDEILDEEEFKSSWKVKRTARTRTECRQDRNAPQKGRVFAWK